MTDSAVPAGRDRVSTVVVSGDVTMDWNLARTRKLVDGGAVWNAEDRTETYGGPGGAAVLARLVEEVGATLADEGLAVEVTGPAVPQESMSPGDPRFHHSYAVWSQYPRRKGDRDRSIWRVEEFLGLDRARPPQGEADGEEPAASPGQADLFIIDDANLLLGRVDEVIEAPPQASREEAYAAAGDMVLQRADVMLAIWDGQDAQGQGGAAEVMAGARAAGKPTAWIHAGNRRPGTMEPTSLGPDQGHVTYENL
jgi:hypothetical protein